MRRRRLAFLLRIRCPPPERLNLTLPVAVTFTLLRKPLWGFCLGIQIFLTKISPGQKAGNLQHSSGKVKWENLQKLTIDERWLAIVGRLGGAREAEIGFDWGLFFVVSWRGHFR